MNMLKAMLGGLMLFWTAIFCMVLPKTLSYFGFTIPLSTSLILTVITITFLAIVYGLLGMAHAMNETEDPKS